MKSKTNKKSEINKVVELFNSLFTSRKGSASDPVDELPSEVEQTNLNQTGGEVMHDGVIDLDLSSVDLFSNTSNTTPINTSADGLVHSLNTYGCVDIEYISSVTNKPIKEVLNDLRGSIYQNPEKFVGDITTGWETADEYLTGFISLSSTYISELFKLIHDSRCTRITYAKLSLQDSSRC